MWKEQFAATAVCADLMATDPNTGWDVFVRKKRCGDLAAVWQRPVRDCATGKQLRHCAGGVNGEGIALGLIWALAGRLAAGARTATMRICSSLRGFWRLRRDQVTALLPPGTCGVQSYLSELVRKPDFDWGSRLELLLALEDMTARRTISPVADREFGWAGRMQPVEAIFTGDSLKRARSLPLHV